VGFEQLIPTPRLRPVVETRVRCTITAGPGRGVKLAASVSGPVHAAHHHPAGGPDVVLFTRDTAGLAGGDTCCTDLSVGEGGSIVVSDTGPTHLLPSGDGRASRQTTDLRLAAGARAVLLPHAVVPFRESRCLTSTRVQLPASSTAVVGGVLSPGRVARGERWAPALYDQRVEIHVGDELIACDAQRVSRSCAQRAGHLVTLIAYSEGVAAGLDRIRLAAGGGSGVSAVTDDLVVLRAIVDSCSGGYSLLRQATTALLPDLVGWEWGRIGYDR
jgi:urease accessory protein UreH